MGSEVHERRVVRGSPRRESRGGVHPPPDAVGFNNFFKKQRKIYKFLIIFIENLQVFPEIFSNFSRKFGQNFLKNYKCGFEEGFGGRAH